LLWVSVPTEQIRLTSLTELYVNVIDTIIYKLRLFEQDNTEIKTEVSHICCDLRDARSATLKASTVALFFATIQDASFAESLDNVAHEIPVMGGQVVNLRTLTARPRTHLDRWSKEFPVCWNPNADTKFITNWIDTLFLQDSTKHASFSSVYKGMREYLQLILGYACIGLVTEQAMFFWVGDGSAGKTTLSNFIRKVMGAFYGGLPASMLVEQAKSKHISTPSPAPNPFLSHLVGKRVAFCTEADSNC
jgi:phage/plasmid-associated DNA primase